MAEEATTEHQQDPQKGAEGEGSEDQRVPYSRFEEVNRRAKEAEQKLAELNDRLLEFEDRDKSEVERERNARARAEQQLQGLMGEVTDLKKGAWVRSAAAELDFHDPEDAVQHLRDQLGALDDQTDAKRLVRNLAKNKKHLIREEKKAERRPIGQMFAGDQARQQQQANGQPKSPQQLAAERELQFAQGLSEQLSQFRDGWHHAGGIT